jgi:hypothetical protein
MTLLKNSVVTKQRVVEYRGFKTVSTYMEAYQSILMVLKRTLKDQMYVIKVLQCFWKVF